MPKTERFFAQVASSISELRETMQHDLDRCYSVNGSMVLDQVTQCLADAFAAYYSAFSRDAFVEATHVRQDAGHLRPGRADDSSIRSRIAAHDRDHQARPPVRG
jgi:hypothetical protein